VTSNANLGLKKIFQLWRGEERRGEEEGEEGTNIPVSKLPTKMSKGAQERFLGGGSRCSLFLVIKPNSSNHSN